MKVYYLLGRLIRPFMVVAMYFYSYVFRTPRARIVLMNEYNEVLLVESWLSGDNWGLPGGGLHRGESPAGAAVRELEEEVGITLQERSLAPLFTLRSRGHDEIAFFAHIRKDDVSEEIPNKFEIKRVEWFSLKALPKLELPAQQVVDTMAKKA